MANSVMEKSITLGSGKLYVMEFTGTVPEHATIEVDSNRLGAISKGASVEYSMESTAVEDDLGEVKEIFLTSEEVVFKAGVLTWNGTTLQKLCSTARVTEDSETGTRTVKIGGVGNQDGKSYLIHFVHRSAKRGVVRVTIVGKNEAGFSLAFAKDESTVLDAEFKAMPLDGEGTLLIFSETKPGTPVQEG